MRRLAKLAFALAVVLTFVLLPQSAEARRVWPAVGARGDADAVAECPAPDQVLVGFGGRVGLWIDQIQLICAPMLADGTHGAPVGSRDRFGGTGGGPSPSVTCDGRSQMFAAYIELTGDSKKVAYVAIDCIDSSGNSARITFGGSESQTAASKQSCGFLQGCDPNELSIPRQACPQESFTGVIVRFGEHVNAIGIVCDRRAAVAPVPVTHARLYNPIHRLQIAPHALAPVSAFGGKWETVTDQNGHYELKLGTTGDGTASGPGGVVSIPMNVSGIFTNTDGAHDYDGTIGGIVQPNTRQLVYTFTQKNGQSGSGVFTLSDDGNSLTGEGVENGTHFTWNGQRAP